MKETCKITDIYWERLFLHIELTGASDKKLYLRGSKGFIHLKQKEIRESINASEVVLNMSTVENRSFLENDSWTLGYFDSINQPQTFSDMQRNPHNSKNNKTLAKEMLEFNKEFKAPQTQENQKDLMRFCQITDEVAEKIDNLDKVFRYGGTVYAYTVNFSLFTSDEICMHLCINSFFMKTNDKWDKAHPKLKSSTFQEYLRRQTNSMMRILMNAFYIITSLLIPQKQKSILLMTEVSTILSGNLSTIYNRIKERGLDKEFIVEFSCRNSIEARSSIQSWIRVVYKVAKSRLIIIDNYAPLFSHLKLNKNTELVQVWHAGAGFKGVGYMRFGKSGSPLPVGSVHKKYTLAVAPSGSLVKVFEEVFGIEEEALFPVGMPRLDDYLEASRVEGFKSAFYNSFPELKKKKIILFAPTYRGEEQRTAYYDYSKVEFDSLYEFCGDEYVVLLKMHPFIKDTKSVNQSFNKPDLSKYSSRIRDFTSFESINELFYITDILITDYSSAYYEFSIFQRPILFFTYDRLLYEKTRGVYQGIRDSAPGKVCDSFEELMEALKNQDYDIEKTIEFSENHFPHKPEGATDKLLDKLLFSQEPQN